MTDFCPCDFLQVRFCHRLSCTVSWSQ